MIKINIKNIMGKIGLFLKNIFQKKGFKSGSDTLILIVSVIGTLILLNVLFTRYNYRYDITENKYYSLSEQTKKVLKGLDRAVKITAFLKKGSYVEKQITDLLKEYKNRTNKLEIDFVDPEKEPALASTYGIREYNTIVFESGAKRKSVFEKEIFNYNPYAQQQQATFFGEEYFTNAILTITQDNEQKVVYFFEGHKENDVDSTDERGGMSEVKKAIEMDNYAVRKINILKESKIPSDCEVLVVASPKTLLVDKEIELLKEYLNKGGKLFVLVDPFVNTRLENVLEKWGIGFNNDFIVDPQSCLPREPISPIPVYMGHEITRDLQKSRVAMVLPLARSLNKSEKKIDGVTISNIIQSASGSSWGERDFKTRNLKFDKGADTEPPLLIGLSVSYWTKATKDTESKEMKIVVVGDADFATNGPISIQGNKDFFVNSINWLMGEKQKISIRAKSADIKRIDLSKGKSQLIFWLNVIITPLLVLLIGVVVWIKRRNL